MKITYCLHTHTKRCGHAQGEDEEYVKAAIDNKITLLGFFDYAFLPKFHQIKFVAIISYFQNTLNQSII